MGLLRIRSVKNDFLLLFQSFAHFLEAKRKMRNENFRLRMEFDPPTSREQQRLTRLILSRRNSGADAEIRNSKFKMSSEMGGQDHENEERINKIEAEHQECLLVDVNDLVDYGTLDADGQKYMREMKTTRTLISIARDLLQGKKDEQQKRLEAEDKVKALEAKVKEFLRQDMTRNVKNLKIWSQATQQFHDAEETLTTSTEYTPTFDHGSPRPSTSMEYTPTFYHGSPRPSSAQARIFEDLRTPAEDIETDEGLRQVPQARISGKVVQAGRELYIQDRFGVSIPIIPTSSKKSSTNKRPSRPREDKSGRSPKKIKQEPKDYGDRINSDKSP